MFRSIARNLTWSGEATSRSGVGLPAMIIAMAGLIAMVGASSLVAATFHYRGGVQDNWFLPTEPATPSAGLQTRFGPGPFAPYDYENTNRVFIETLGDCPSCISAADLTIGLKPFIESQANNDTIQFSFTDSSGTAVGPHWISDLGNPSGDNTVYPLTWGSTNFPNGVVKTFDLKNLQLGTFNTSGSTANLLPALRQYRSLDIDVQDDTSVDFIDLKVTTLLGGDIDGDGCVDLDDYNLLLTRFNQPTPDGIGDPNGDGTLNVQDLSIVIADMGKCCPEPTSAILFALCGCVCSAFARRSRARAINA